MKAIEVRAENGAPAAEASMIPAAPFKALQDVGYEG